MNMIEQKEYDRMKREISYKDEIIDALKEQIKNLESQLSFDRNMESYISPNAKKFY